MVTSSSEDVTRAMCEKDLKLSVTVVNRSAETGNLVNYHLPDGGHESFDLTNYTSHYCRSGDSLWLISFRVSLGTFGYVFKFGGLWPSRPMFGAQQTIATTKISLSRRRLRRSL